MVIVFLTHPEFLNIQSIPRFTRMLEEGMKKRGHATEVWAPIAKFSKVPAPLFLKKWLGYIDQYLIFPRTVKRRIRQLEPNTLFVFSDQALGPWIPLVANRPHVIHCHDFLAQRSAKNEIPENKTGWTGKLYQKMIRKGYVQGNHFISVSKKTKADLHTFLKNEPSDSAIVYNGLNQKFTVQDASISRKALGERIGRDLSSGYFLHVGGNQWYKNRQGIIEIYDAWRTKSDHKIPLVLIGEFPSVDLRARGDASKFNSDILWLTNIEDAYVRFAYSGATVFLFPSLAEGFGWPIAEAMACGCPVITTNEAPMTEVAGEAGFYISRRPSELSKTDQWATAGADKIDLILRLSTKEREAAIKAGIANAKRFDSESTLNEIEKIYQSILNKY